jgi:hypothetical protein
MGADATLVSASARILDVACLPCSRGLDHLIFIAFTSFMYCTINTFVRLLQYNLLFSPWRSLQIHILCNKDLLFFPYMLDNECGYGCGCGV